VTVTLVTGATGAVGPSVVRALMRSGRQVRTLCRTCPGPDVLAGRTEVMVGDITSKADVERAVDGVSEIVHLAARLHANDVAAAAHDDYRRTNVEGTRNLVHAAAAARVRRLVSFSTVSVYASGTGVRAHEETPPRPATIYGQTKLSAEGPVIHAVDADGNRFGTVLRLGSVYGPRIRGNYARLVEALSAGRFVPIGSGANRRALVFEDDVAHATHLALEHPAAVGRVFNLTDNRDHTLTDIIAAICAALGRRPPQLAVPLQPTRALAAGIDRAGALCGWRLALRHAVDKYTEDLIVDARRICTELGFEPQVDLQTGWRRALGRP